jgi:membrane protein
MTTTMKRPTWKTIQRLVIELVDSRLENGAAALAFYAILAVFPAAIFGLSLLPYLHIPNLQQAIFDLLGDLLPRQAAALFKDTVQRILSQRHTGLLSFGLLFAIWSATSGLVAVMEQLDVVQRAKHNRGALRARGRAFLLLFPLFALIIATFGLVIFGGTMQDWLAKHLGSSSLLLNIFAAFRWLVITFAIISGTAVMYWAGPTEKQRFRLFSPGTIFATLGQMLASFGLRFYVEQFGDYDAVYGSLGAVIVLLLWLFVFGWVFLVGAEIDQFLLADRRARSAPS